MNYLYIRQNLVQIIPHEIKNIYPQGCPFTGETNDRNLEIMDIVQGYQNTYNKILVRKDISQTHKNSFLVYPEPEQRSDSRGLFRLVGLNNSFQHKDVLVNLPLGSMIFLYYRYLVHKCSNRYAIQNLRREIRGCQIKDNFPYDTSGNAIMLPYCDLIP